MPDRRTKWWVGIISGLCLVFLHSIPLLGILDRAVALSLDEPTEGPSIVFSEVEYDFGQVDGVSDVSHDFTVKNLGKSNLNITRVNPG